MQSGAEDFYEVVWQSALWYMTFQSKPPTEHKTPGVLIKRKKNKIGKRQRQEGSQVKMLYSDCFIKVIKRHT